MILIFSLISSDKSGNIANTPIEPTIDPSEAIKRLAASQGIDVLNLVKSPETMEAEMQQQQAMAAQQQLVKQAGSIASSPLMDPTKNPQGLANAGLAADAETPPEQ